jgi:hypothetical protein
MVAPHGSGPPPHDGAHGRPGWHPARAQAPGAAGRGRRGPPGTGSLMAHAWYYYAVIGLQILCALHVLRARNDYYWLLIIFFMPLLGSAIYAIVHHRTLFGAVRLPFDLSIPMVEALNGKRVEQAFRKSDTLSNRIDLANLQINRGGYAQALELLRRALDGPLKGDITLLFTCARAHYAKGEPDQAIVLLENAGKVRNNEKLRQRCLLLALCREATGDDAQADEKYQAAQGGYAGEEARARYGLFLKRTGRAQEAREMFRRILESAESAPWAYRREQKAWIAIARENLASTGRA